MVVGHSERRTLFGMSDATVAATLKAVLRHAMVPIVCVGETEEERTQDARRRSWRSRCSWPSRACRPSWSAAWSCHEPLWAIGTGQAASAMDAEDASVYIRALVGKVAGQPAADAVRIQYGGSVQAENAQDFMAEPDVDGLLVGGASLQAGTFLDVIRAGGACYRSGVSFVTWIYIVIEVLSALGLIFLILMHSGKGGGLSDMFGGSVGAAAQGSTVVERNLDRITVTVAIIFTFATLTLGLRLQ